ncbi:MAG: hypothetical protein HWE20_04000 [Gammaproteobacteria bacterium]|nr:hypothetical protein [Gammaproteobacteria bacterium]
MEYPNARKIDLDRVDTLLTNKRGIYFWIDRSDNTLVYIGIAIGVGGLKKRIAQQHLNPKYLEYRSEKHTSKDEFQLKYAIPKFSKKTGKTKYGIDKSAFRKAIGRMRKLKPGDETVNYIKTDLMLEVFESEDVEFIKSMEKHLIVKIQPKFNSAHKNA